MTPPANILRAFLQNRCTCWVLVPQLETDDEILRYYYDFSQSIDEYARVFRELECAWNWRQVLLRGHPEVLAELSNNGNGKIPVIINLCDGDEINGAPGISVINALHSAGLLFTGADADYFSITTSKIAMKHAFDAHNVLTPPWQILDAHGADCADVFDRIGSPLIVKPSVSGGSMGVTLKSVVTDASQLHACIASLMKGYRGWNLARDGILAERYICGREFTVLIVGSTTDADRLIVYPPIERVFHPSLPEYERFLSFDRRWETYDDEPPMPDGAFVYTYESPETSLMASLKDTCLRAYHAVNGMGYGRIDLRMDQETGMLFVLEVNAQCGLSEDENLTSIGAMLRIAGKSFSQLTEEIISDAFHRNGIEIA